jgi:nicotinamidase-related amidase
VSELLAIARAELPIALAPYALAGRRAGLVIVDEVNGFATVGAGALAPAAPNAQIERMIAETDRLARGFADAGRPIAVFLDSHQPGRPEPPYPPHCERGTGENELVAPLRWLEGCAEATLIEKDCINGYIGAERGGAEQGRSGGNRILDWVNGPRLEAMIVVGICTDICVMDFVLTMLSVRNHGMTPTLRNIVVYEPGCATYDLPMASALARGLPATAAHPQELSHHIGLSCMAARGAILASALHGV